MESIMLDTKPIPISQAEGNDVIEKTLLHLFQQSQMTSRAMLAGRLGTQFDGQRDLYKTFGYLLNPGYQDFKNLFDRQGISTRIVKKFAEDTWNKPAVIIDGESRSDKPDDKPTPFITEFVALAKRLRIWQMFKQADVMLGYSKYSILFMGVPGKSYADPAENGMLAYLSAFDENMAGISTYITDTNNPLYGLPQTYEVRFNAVDIGMPVPEGAGTVHYTRVIHIAEDKLASRIYGTPRLQTIINRLFDLEKTVGSGAEASWLTVFKGMLFTAKEGADLPAKDSPEAKYLDEQITNFINKIQRYAVLDGVDVHDMGGASISIRDIFDVIIEDICGSIGISQRILLGSERGQLASDQDKKEWNQVITSRRTNFAEPDVLDPFLAWCVAHKVLPPPKSGKWSTEWEEVYPMTKTEKADYGAKLAQGATTITGGMPESAMDTNEWRVASGLNARTDQEQAAIDQQIAQEEETKRKQALADKIASQPKQIVVGNPGANPANGNGKGASQIPAADNAPVKKNILIQALEKLGLRRNSFPDHRGIPGHQGGSLPRGESGGSSATVTSQAAKDIYELLKSHPDGFSYRPADGSSPTTGYMSSISDGPVFDPRKSEEELTQEIQGFLDEKANLFGPKDRYVGGWLSKGNFYLDASQNYRDELEVMKDASASHQIGVFDVKHLDTIFVDKWLDAHPDFDAGPGVREYYKANPS
jgi:hypothetical protein